MKKRIIEKFKETKGAYAILATVLVLTMASLMAGYTDILHKKWALNEVQTIMDSAGINTLQNQVNNKALRAEIVTLGTDQNDVSGEQYANRDTSAFTASEQQKYKSDMELYYKAEMQKQVTKDTGVTSYNVERVNITFSYDTWGLGTTSKKLPQVNLESVARIKIKQTGIFDNITSVQRTMYSSRNNANFTVTYAGTTDDGETELIVHSVTRLVYR